MTPCGVRFLRVFVQFPQHLQTLGPLLAFGPAVQLGSELPGAVEGRLGEENGIILSWGDLEMFYFICVYYTYIYNIYNTITITFATSSVVEM